MSHIQWRVLRQSPIYGEVAEPYSTEEAAWRATFTDALARVQWRIYGQPAWRDAVTP